MTNQPSPGLPVIACFADRCMKAQLITESAPDSLNRTVELVIKTADLENNPPELLARMQVRLDPSLGTPASDRLRFGGYATLLEPIDQDTWRVVAHNVADWAEAKTGGLGIRNFQAPEVLFASMRDLGMTPDRIHIAGWKPPLERFMVVIPVEGIEPKGELDTGTTPVIGLTGDPEVPKRFVGLGPDDLQAAFSEPGYWAMTLIDAHTMWDAEREAIRRFERIVGRLALAARYSFAQTPDTPIRAFRRSRQLEAVRLREISGVEGMQTHRIWLRGYSRPRLVHPIDSGSIDGFGRFIGASDDRVDEAITAWRRATTERDRSVASVALAEALEFFAAKVDVPSLFTPKQLKAIRKAALNVSPEFDSQQEERLKWGVGRLNDPPAAVRLRAAIDEAGARCSESEFDLLRRVREIRRKVLHGQVRELPTAEELNLAIALVGRLLMFRLKHLRDHPEPLGD